MKALFIVLSAASAAGSLAYVNEYLEPNVQRHPGVLPESVCKQLIDLGEEAGFLVQQESIDLSEQTDPTKKYIPSQTIDIYHKGWNEPDLPYLKPSEHIERIGNEAIYSVLQPWIPKITQIVKDNRNHEAFTKLYPNEPNREPDLHWIFFRKYSPNDARNSLKHHVDTNMNTVNIELSDDYEGGGLFYIKPFAKTGSVSEEYYEEKYGYDWLATVKRENTSDMIFPDLKAGDAIFYNYTVRHGVAPCESGTRYSMAFFFDMDNPTLYVKPELEIDIRSMMNVEVDIELVYDAKKNEELSTILYEKITPGELISLESYHGNEMNILLAGTDVVLAEIKVKRDQTLYKIVKEVPTEEERFEVKLHNTLEEADVDIVLVYSAAQKRNVYKELFISVLPDEMIIDDLFFEGDMIQAYIAKTKTLVGEFEITRDKYLYLIGDGALSSEL